MVRNFYFRKQAEIATGSANFSSRISASAGTYGLTSAQATAYGLVNTALQSAYTAGVNPLTRTSVTIQTKNAAIKTARREAMLLSKIVYATATVTDAQLVELGLLPRPTYTPIQPTTIAPVVEAVSVVGRLVKARIHSASLEGSRKPAGCVGAQLFSYVGPTPPTEARDYHYEGLATRATADILFPNTVPSGATAWIAAAWVSQRGASSIACAPVNVTIQGGPILAEAV